jgi:hypothetical protein
MRGISDVVLGVVGCFAIFGAFSLVKRLVVGVFSFSFVTKSSRTRAPDANGLNFENEHPMIGEVMTEHEQRGRQAARLSH